MGNKMTLQEMWKPIQYEDDFYILYYGVRNLPKKSDSLISITKKEVNTSSYELSYSMREWANY